MAEIKHGVVTLSVDDHLVPPPEAGNLTVEEVRRLPKARPGIGLACQASAQAIEQVGAALTLPPELSPEALRSAGERAEEVDQVIRDLELLLQRFRQANLIFDADALARLSQLNELVKLKARQTPEVETAFSVLRSFFKR
jgi:hypothetical protein